MLPLLAVLFAAIAFATASPLAKAAVLVPPIAIAMGRTLVAGSVLLIARPAATAKAVRALSTKEKLALAGAGALLAGHFGLYLAGLAATSLPAAVSLVSLEPLSVVLVAWMSFGIRPSRAEGIGVIVATIGALVVASGAGEGEHRLAGDLMVLGAVVLFGAYVAVARHLRDAMPAIPYAAAVYAVCTLLLAPLGVPGALAAHAPASSWLYVLALGLVPTLVGHTLLQNAARHVPPAIVAMVSPGETLGSLAIGAVVMGTVPTAREGIGAALVLLGAVVAIKR